MQNVSKLGQQGYKEILTLHVPFDPKSNLLYKRLPRWLEAAACPSQLHISVERARLVSSRLAGKVPPSVLAAVWRSWCNGWCTTRRFQEECRECLLDSECNGTDCLEHYACCPATRRYLSRRIPLSLDPATITSFLILDEVDDNAMLFRAVHIYAVYGVVNHVRAGQLPKGSFDLDMLLWEKWRTALAKQRSVVHLLNESWLRR